MPNLDRARKCLQEASQWIKWSARLRDVEQKNPILVYQMGKVGSSTIVSTLERAGVTEPVLHVHTLVPEEIRIAVNRQRNSQVPFLHEHLIVSSIVGKKLGASRFPCRIVTLTREPVARAISFVFEDLKKQAPEARREDGSIDVSAVTRATERVLSAPDNGNADPSLWFDRELKVSFGVDVFEHPYDFERGYTIIRSGNVPVLVMRMEDINRAVCSALAEFLQIDPARIRLAEANVGVKKWYAIYMDEVKRTLKLEDETLERLIGTRYFQHFYASESERITQRWAKAVSN